VIDFVALAIPAWILSIIGSGQYNPASGVRSGTNFLYWLGVLYWWGFVLIYNRWYRGGTTGYSIGRGVAGVKVVKESTGEVLGPGMAFVRDLAHLIDNFICGVGWLFPLWDAKRQTLADKIMSTVVLAEPQPKS
jgi:uncharacterized RDD family membrane protein YckC